MGIHHISFESTNCVHQEYAIKFAALRMRETLLRKTFNTLHTNLLHLAYISSVETTQYLKRTQSKTDPIPALRDPVPRDEKIGSVQGISGVGPKKELAIPQLRAP